MSDTYKPCEITVKRGPEKMDLSPKREIAFEGFNDWVLSGVIWERRAEQRFIRMR